MDKYKTYAWTPKLAYAVGLITTDGNLSSDKRHISLTSSDKQLLSTFRECLNLTNKITKNINGSFAKRQSYRIQFGNVLFYRWLITIGLMPRKTSRLAQIEIPDNFLRDFLRGHLDGDGSIVVYEDRYNTFKDPKYVYNRLYVNFLSASQKHIDWIAKKVKEILDIKGNVSFDNRKGRGKRTKTIWKLRFAKKKSLRLLSWIYYKPDLPSLKRKQETYNNFLKFNN
jgi:hypothetical protein